MWNGKSRLRRPDDVRRARLDPGVIEGFFDTGLVDEVLVIDNNAQAGTEEEVRKT